MRQGPWPETLPPTTCCSTAKTPTGLAWSSPAPYGQSPSRLPTTLAGPGEAWLHVLDWDRLDWVRGVLDADVGVQVTRPGREGFATRLRRWRELQPISMAAEGSDGYDDWFNGWTDTRVDHYSGYHNEEPGLEPFDGWTSCRDDDDEITIQTWNHD